MRGRYARRGRAGIAELTAAVLTIAITLIAGFALFGYVNGQAANSEEMIGVANAANVNFLNERFVIVDMAFSGSSKIQIWIYNNGNLNVQLQQITVFDSNKSTTYVNYNTNPPTSGCGSVLTPSNGAANGFTFGSGGTIIPVGSNPIKITLSLPSGCSFVSGTYYVNVLGMYGNKVIYYSVK